MVHTCKPNFVQFFQINLTLIYINSSFSLTQLLTMIWGGHFLFGQYNCVLWFMC